MLFCFDFTWGGGCCFLCVLVICFGITFPGLTHFFFFVYLIQLIIKCSIGPLTQVHVHFNSKKIGEFNQVMTQLQTNQRHHEKETQHVRIQRRGTGGPDPNFVNIIGCCVVLSCYIVI